MRLRKNINKSRHTDIEKWSSGNNIWRLKAQGRHMEVPCGVCLCVLTDVIPVTRIWRKVRSRQTWRGVTMHPRFSTWNWQMMGECPQWYKNQQATSEPDSSRLDRRILSLRMLRGRISVKNLEQDLWTPNCGTCSKVGTYDNSKVWCGWTFFSLTVTYVLIFKNPCI